MTNAEKSIHRSIEQHRIRRIPGPSGQSMAICLGSSGNPTKGQKRPLYILTMTKQTVEKIIQKGIWLLGLPYFCTSLSGNSCQDEKVDGQAFSKPLRQGKKSVGTKNGRHAMWHWRISEERI